MATLDRRLPGARRVSVLWEPPVDDPGGIGWDDDDSLEEIQLHRWLAPHAGAARSDELLRRGRGLEPPPDPQHFASVFREYQRYVASIGNRILRQESAVEDLVQDVFLATYQEFHQLRDPGALKSWLATIATRLAWKRLGFPRAHLRLQVMATEDLPSVESPEASPEQRADLSSLLTRLAQLPEPLRETWSLRFIDGETLPEIARLCQCSPSTVQRRLREAARGLLSSKREARRALELASRKDLAD